MVIQFFGELTALLFLFYFFLGFELTANSLKLLGACITTILYCIFLFAGKISIPFALILAVILSFLFEEKIYYIICLTIICILFEVIAGYVCSTIIHLFVNTVDISITLLQIDKILYLLEIIISFLVRGRRKIHANILHEIDSKGYCFLLFICLFSLCFVSLAETFLYFEVKQSEYYLGLLLISLFIIFLIFISCIVIVLHQCNIELQHINYLKQKCLDLEQENYLNSKTRFEEIKAFRHDFKSHIFALQSLVSSKEWDKVEHYINKLF